MTPARNLLRTLLLGLACFLVSGVALAHKPSDSYLTLDASGRTIAARWDIALRDLDYTLGLDRDGNGAITWGELRARLADVDAYALPRLVVAGDAEVCTQSVQDHQVVTHSDGTYVVLHFVLDCKREPHALDIDYQLFFESDSQHRGLVHLDAAGTTSALTFASDHRHEHLEVRAVSRWAQFRSIVRVGVHHIWEGYDHLLFLLALLLPSVLRRSGPSDGAAWEPVPRFRPALWDVVRIVTAFTVAHSLTLSLAALDVVRLPSRLTESAIAASVVVAAANNVVPLLREDRWLAAFALGLLHGFGFSATLVDLGLPRSSLLVTLFGFNLGVEIGQLTVVAAFLPLAFAARGTVFYRRFVLVGGSVLIAIVASVWFVERAFRLKIL
jgi:HupE / UreJ protein